MVNERDLAEAATLRRRRLVLAFGHGSDRRHRISAAARDALGYRGVTPLTVPAGWRDGIPTGPPLDRIRLPGRPRLYLEEGTDALYVEVRGVLRPVANHTTLRLVYGRSVPRPTPVSPTRLRTMPRGVPLGESDWPSSPPPVARMARDAWACVSGTDATVRVLPALPATGLRYTPEDGAEVWQPAQTGVLVAATEQAREPSEQAPAWLVADGLAFLITSPAVLHAFGYNPDQLLVLPKSWVDLLPPGPPLNRITV